MIAVMGLGANDVLRQRRTSSMFEMLRMVVAVVMESTMCQIRPREGQPHNQGETCRRRR